MSNKTGAGKTAGVAIGILAAIVGGTIGREAVHSLFAREPDVTSQVFLNKVASEINRSLPMSLDKETDLMNVLGLEAMIVYNYRLVNAEASQIDSAALVNELKPTVSKAACSTPQTREDFLKKGITMRYTYSDKDRVHIASFDVTPASCDF
jgi:hypothetical protein